MGKASVIIYITVAVLLLLFISLSPQKPSHHRHRRLKLRSNFSFSSDGADKKPHPHPHHEPVPFDPLVADIERRREDKQWEKTHFEELSHEAPGAESQPEWEDFMNAEDYLNDEERFNVTNRLVLLFPKLDVDPPDEYATEHELTEWILKNSQREVMHRTQREMELHDKNRDGFVSFAEYEPPSWVRNSGLVFF
ncbi:calcium-binding EF hand family protein [Actinidia rufa]|uniref:Calcium-binding EF hand family protein n=1 Tax=Actinidia rufa TaxID=165716 RepID=A0A7J0DIU5_9ERIC|nr:calcium-binding EF hand family protein [Actinidia rufa]